MAGFQFRIQSSALVRGGMRLTGPQSAVRSPSPILVSFHARGAFHGCVWSPQLHVKSPSTPNKVTPGLPLSPGNIYNSSIALLWKNGSW